MAEKKWVTMSNWGCFTIFYPYKFGVVLSYATYHWIGGETPTLYHLVGLSNGLLQRTYLRSPGDVFGGNPGGWSNASTGVVFFFSPGATFLCGSLYICGDTCWGSFFWELSWRGVETCFFLFFIGWILSFFEGKLVRFLFESNDFFTCASFQKRLFF